MVRVETNVVDGSVLDAVAAAVAGVFEAEQVDPAFISVQFAVTDSSTVYVGRRRFPEVYGAATGFAVVTVGLSPRRTPETRRRLAGAIAVAFASAVDERHLSITFAARQPGDVWIGSRPLVPGGDHPAPPQPDPAPQGPAAAVNPAEVLVGTRTALAVVFGPAALTADVDTPLADLTDATYDSLLNIEVAYALELEFGIDSIYEAGDERFRTALGPSGTIGSAAALSAERLNPDPE